MAQSGGHAHDLRAAFDQPGCPICQLGRRSVERCLDIFGFESVNDIGLRERIRAARGLCNYHSWQFLDTAGEILGSAIIVRDVLRTLRRETAHLTPGAAFDQCLLPTAPCLVCEIHHEATATYLQVLVEQLANGAFSRAFARSDGLCWHHLCAGLRYANDRAARTLVESWRRTLSSDGDAGSQVTGDHRGPASSSSVDNTAGESARRPVRAGKPLGTTLGLVRPRSATQRRWVACFGEPGLTDHFGNVESLVVAELATPGSAGEEIVSSPETPRELGSCDVCARVEASRKDGHPAAGDRLIAPLCNRHAHLRAPVSNLRELVAALEELLRSPGSGLDHPSLLMVRRIWNSLRIRLGVRVGGWRERAVVSSSNGEACADCQTQAKLEAGAIRRISFDRGRDSAAGLCRIHLRLALASDLPEERKRALIARQHYVWDRLSDEVGEYIRKQDYRFRDEPWGSEQTAPWRALEALVGRSGVR